MPNEEEYYKSLKSESYKSMLNAEVQASVARDQAMKYTQQSLQNAGLASQGLSESSMLGTQNQYQTALQNAAQNYNTELNNINQQQYEAQRQANNTEFEALTTFMQNTSSVDEMNSVLDKYGVKLNGDGSFNYENAAYLNDSDKRQLETLYSLYKTQFDNQTYGNAFEDYTSAYEALTDQNGNTGKFNDELKVLFNVNNKGLFNTMLGSNTLQNGDTLKIASNSGGKASYAYLIYRNGQWYQTTSNAYNNSSNRYYLRSQGGRNDSYYLDKNGTRIYGKHI